MVTGRSGTWLLARVGDEEEPPVAGEGEAVRFHAIRHHRRQGTGAGVDTIDIGGADLAFAASPS